MKKLKFAKIRTSNYTATPLRRSIIVPRSSLVRLGSLTPTSSAFPGRTDIIEVNTVDAIQNSRSKLRMKDCFVGKDIPQAEWWTYIPGQNIFPVKGVGDRGEASAGLPYPIVVKRVFGFQGKGMQLLNNEGELRVWLRSHDSTEGWFFERFYSYAREYRLHVAKGIGCFLAWRKLRTHDAEDRWFFNSVNSNWVGVDHELFNRPTNWTALEKAAMDCLEATGLDIGGN